MTNFLSPTFWGSLLALVSGIVITPLAVAVNGLPAHVSSLPPGNEYVAFFSISAISFVYALRYYCALSLNAFKDGRAAFLGLPTTLRKLIFYLLVVLCLLCLMCAGAIVGLSLQLALVTCATMSLLSLICWSVCWILGAVGHWPKVSAILGGAEGIFFTLAAVALFAVFNFSGNGIGIALPILAFLALMVFFHEFIRIYYQPMQSHWVELHAHMNAAPGEEAVDPPTKAA